MRLKGSSSATEQRRAIARMIHRRAKIVHLLDAQHANITYRGSEPGESVEHSLGKGEVVGSNPMGGFVGKFRGRLACRTRWM